jgi:glyoxylase-like metal-dependent hydrolase (beta-lactamase superfamily II)
MSDRPTGSASAAPSADLLPPPEEIVPARSGRGALYRLRTPMTSRALPWVMPYAFVGGPDEGVTLFDSGYGTREATSALTEQLAALGRAPADVSRLIVSHAHPDHVGMASWLREQSPDLELVMHRREADFYAAMEHGHRRWESEMREWGVRHGFPVEAVEAARREHDEEREQRSDDTSRETERRSWQMRRVPPSRVVEDGESIAFGGWVLTAVWTPGHTVGHLCIHIADEGLTFTGDHVLSRITPNVSYGPDDEQAGRNPLGEFIDSLKRTAGLGTRLALPAHEDLIEDLPARCHAIIEHHHHRADEVLAGIGRNEGGATAFEVASRVTWNKPWETFSIWKRRSALGETLAHLRLLEEQGRVRRATDSDDAVRWLPAS